MNMHPRSVLNLSLARLSPLVACAGVGTVAPAVTARLVCAAETAAAAKHPMARPTLQRARILTSSTGCDCSGRVIFARGFERFALRSARPRRAGRIEHVR